MRPLVVSMGDPAGIGAELIGAAHRALRGTPRPWVVIGCADTLAERGAGPLRRIQHISEADAIFSEALPVLDRPLPRRSIAGHPHPSAAASILDWIKTGVDLCLVGEAAGLVTAPIAKAELYAAGFAFKGHTEYLDALTQNHAAPYARGPVMMLTAQDLRTALVTIHIPLAEVAFRLTSEDIIRTAEVTAQALPVDFGLKSARLALAALNPHAGESGALGREEIELLQPVAQALRDRGYAITDPKPADTLFHAEARKTYDAVICLYHDQALIPVKTLDFWGGVNITLGLPIVRTSPDHGAGFDIAGKGLARPDSLIAAIREADQIAVRRFGA